MDLLCAQSLERRIAQDPFRQCFRETEALVEQLVDRVVRGEVPHQRIANSATGEVPEGDVADLVGEDEHQLEVRDRLGERPSEGDAAAVVHAGGRHATGQVEMDRARLEQHREEGQPPVHGEHRAVDALR